MSFAKIALCKPKSHTATHLEKTSSSRFRLSDKITHVACSTCQFNVVTNPIFFNTIIPLLVDTYQMTCDDQVGEADIM